MPWSAPAATPSATRAERFAAAFQKRYGCGGISITALSFGRKLDGRVSMLMVVLGALAREGSQVAVISS